MGRSGGGEKTFKKRYYKCACQVYECRVEFGAKPETVQLKSLKADLEKSAVRIVLGDLLLACRGAVESRHCLFTLICQGCMREYRQKISPRCSSRLAVTEPGAPLVPLRGPPLIPPLNYVPLLVALRETLMKCFILRVSAAH